MSKDVTIPNGGLIKTLLSTLWAVVVGFCGLCFWGYTDVKTNTERLTQEQGQQDVKIERLIECTQNTKESLSEIKSMIRQIYRHTNGNQ